jgi:hypothetical protein
MCTPRGCCEVARDRILFFRSPRYWKAQDNMWRLFLREAFVLLRVLMKPPACGKHNLELHLDKAVKELVLVLLNQPPVRI